MGTQGLQRDCILRKRRHGAAQGGVCARAKRGDGLFFPSGHLFQLEQGSVHGDTSFRRHPPTTPSRRDQKISDFWSRSTLVARTPFVLRSS